MIEAVIERAPPPGGTVTMDQVTDAALFLLRKRCHPTRINLNVDGGWVFG